MNLTTTTDFEMAAYLLGCYEQEVKQTGIIDYPFHYESSLPLPVNPIEEPNDSPETATWSNNFALSCDLPTPKALNEAEPVTHPSICSEGQISPTVISPGIMEVNVPTPSVIINTNPPSEVVIVSTPTEMIAETEEMTEPSPKLSLEEQLLKHQEEERRLFYLYIQELETSGDLTKLPQVLRP